MPWRGEEYPGEFPTLGYVVAEWVQVHCVVPDRDARGLPYILTEEQLRFLLYHYGLTPDGKWLYPRGSQLVRSQKWGKGPLAAAWVCAEAAGPVLFDGWDAQGEPVGKPWATPHIQITACSEDQTDNTWRALQPMIELGPLSDSLITDTGLTRINLPGGGLIEPVTASARSRLGQRISAAVEDQTESWLKSNHGWALADNQRRNLAGVGGRFFETCNAPDPVENSVAQRTPLEPGVYIDDVDGGAGSVRNKVERRRVMRKVYGDSLIERGGWVDLDRIDVEVEALLEHDPAQAERFFLNRKLASEGAAFDIVRFRELAKPQTPRPGSLIVLGGDGARFEDAIAVIATDVHSGYQWPLIIIERPDGAPDDYEHPLEEVEGAVVQAFETDYIVWKAYFDPQWIEGLLENLQGRFGEKRVKPWYTNRPMPMAWAVRKYQQAITTTDPDHRVTHSGNEIFEQHVANARKKATTVLDDKERPMHVISKDSIRSPRKIDAASAAVVSWEARGDAIAAGALQFDPHFQAPSPPPARQYAPNEAPPIEWLNGRETVGPMGSMS